MFQNNTFFFIKRKSKTKIYKDETKCLKSREFSFIPQVPSSLASTPASGAYCLDINMATKKMELYKEDQLLIKSSLLTNPLRTSVSSFFFCLCPFDIQPPVGEVKLHGTFETNQ